MRPHAASSARPGVRRAPKGSFDLYVALRTYDSALIDLTRALQEAARVVRPGGLVTISVSDGYLTDAGTLVRGQIGASGSIDRLATWRKLSQIIECAEALGIADLDFFDFGSEVGFFGRTAR